jgi:hypothetical protein
MIALAESLAQAAEVLAHEKRAFATVPLRLQAAGLTAYRDSDCPITAPGRWPDDVSGLRLSQYGSRPTA